MKRFFLFCASLYLLFPPSILSSQDSLLNSFSPQSVVPHAPAPTFFQKSINISCRDIAFGLGGIGITILGILIFSWIRPLNQNITIILKDERREEQSVKKNKNLSNTKECAVYLNLSSKQLEQQQGNALNG